MCCANKSIKWGDYIEFHPRSHLLKKLKNPGGVHQSQLKLRRVNNVRGYGTHRA